MQNTTRILIWTDAPKPYVDAVHSAGLDKQVRLDTLARADKPSAEQLAETEVMVAWGAAPGVLPRMPKLRWAQALTAGVEHWMALPDLPPALTLSCARGTHRRSMPENILGALFALTKPYAAAAEDQKTRTWARHMAVPLNGSTLGILGIGEIGERVAKLAHALGMKVIGTRRNVAPMPGIAEVLPSERTDEVLAQADYLLLLLPATPATDNFINAERLAKMKPGAWLLNFGRGHLINDDDLIAAVKAKRIAGAVLDVFRQEPLPAEHPFWTTENIRVLPHIGGGFPNRDAVVAQLFAESLGQFLNGKPPRNVVDRAVGY